MRHMVRSAYHVARNKIEDGKGSSSNLDVYTKLWKIVWNMKVPTIKKDVSLEGL